MAEQRQRVPSWSCEEHLGTVRSACAECRIAELEAQVERQWSVAQDESKRIVELYATVERLTKELAERRYDSFDVPAEREAPAQPKDPTDG